RLERDDVREVLLGADADIRAILFRLLDERGEDVLKPAFVGEQVVRLKGARPLGEVRRHSPELFIRDALGQRVGGKTDRTEQKDCGGEAAQGANDTMRRL